MIIGMVGLPRSGKSTFISKIMEQKNFAIVSRDDIRISLHGERYLAPAEPMVKTISEIMFKSLIRSGCDILLDEINLDRKSRQYWQKFSKDQIFWVHVNTDVDECIKRARKTIQLNLIPVIDSMNKGFMTPQKDEALLVTINKHGNFSPDGYNILDVESIEEFMYEINSPNLSSWKKIIDEKYPDEIPY